MVQKKKWYLVSVCKYEKKKPDFVRSPPGHGPSRVVMQKCRAAVEPRMDAPSMFMCVVVVEK
jgi:hypothetical protein